MSPLLDVSHAVEDGMVAYPGLPGPTTTDHLTREASRARDAEDTEFPIGTGLPALLGGQFRFFAVPVKVQGLGTFPVRAFAITR